MKILFLIATAYGSVRAAWSKGDCIGPASEDGRVQLTREEFALLIGGIDLTATTKRKWHRKAIAEKDTISQITA